ncbi:AI-2E family transporter [Streptomyces sp. XM4193]|uniref:AI-2E family transporter n=1 Tax=Streptomyces sp. XM4193 TaxID=2929782 RepID=UPI001FF8A7F6|nr:AI-2E family transporter [Streptomyces sp. XM4193]MCK1795168.1 AI-2E family transporter [Streptomyces sp. XM4193]
MPHDDSSASAEPDAEPTERLTPAQVDTALRLTIRWSSALLLGAAVVALFLWLAYTLRVALIPALVAVLVAALVAPLDRLLRRVGVPKGAAAGLSATALVLAVGGVVWIVVRVLANAATDLAASMRSAVHEVSDSEGPAADLVSTAADSLTSLGRGIAGEAAKGVLGGLSLAGQLLAGGVLALALVFFLLRDRGRLVRTVRERTPGGQGTLALRMGRRAWEAMAGYMRGTTVIAAIDAVFITVGLALLGVPQAYGLGALVFVGAYVPFVGAFLSGTVAVLVAFADQGLWIAAAALGVVLLVQFIEGTFLQPIVQSRTVALHPALVMVAVTAGASVAGLLGTLMAVPLTAAAFGVVTELRRALVDLPAEPAA